MENKKLLLSLPRRMVYSSARRATMKSFRRRATIKLSPHREKQAAPPGGNEQLLLTRTTIIGSSPCGQQQVTTPPAGRRAIGSCPHGERPPLPTPLPMENNKRFLSPGRRRSVSSPHREQTLDMENNNWFRSLHTPIGGLSSCREKDNQLLSP